MVRAVVVIMLDFQFGVQSLNLAKKKKNDFKNLKVVELCNWNSGSSWRILNMEFDI